MACLIRGVKNPISVCSSVERDTQDQTGQCRGSGTTLSFYIFFARHEILLPLLHPIVFRDGQHARRASEPPNKPAKDRVLAEKYGASATHTRLVSHLAGWEGAWRGTLVRQTRTTFMWGRRRTARKNWTFVVYQYFSTREILRSQAKAPFEPCIWSLFPRKILPKKKGTQETSGPREPQKGSDCRVPKKLRILVREINPRNVHSSPKFWALVPRCVSFAAMWFRGSSKVE